MAKLIVRSETTGAEIEITEDGEGYGGTCTDAGVRGPNLVAHEARKVIHHHRLVDAVEFATIHMEVYHDDDATVTLSGEDA
jgi:hypothetical protein